MIGRWRGPALAGLVVVAAVLVVGSTNPARAQCYGYNAYAPGVAYGNGPGYGYGYGYGYNVAPRYYPVIPRVYAYNYNYGYGAGYRRPYYGGGYYGHRGGYYHGGYRHGRFRR